MDPTFDAWLDPLLPDLDATVGIRFHAEPARGGEETVLVHLQDLPPCRASWHLAALRRPPPGQDRRDRAAPGGQHPQRSPSPRPASRESVPEAMHLHRRIHAAVADDACLLVGLVRPPRGLGVLPLMPSPLHLALATRSLQ